MCKHIEIVSTGAHPLIRFGPYLQYPLWPCDGFCLCVVVRAEWTSHPSVSMNLVAITTLYLMLLYFLILSVFGILNGARPRLPAFLLRRGRPGQVSFSGFRRPDVSLLMLAGYARLPVPFFPYIVLAAMMTSVPFSISVAYRMYHFPSWTRFFREVLSV